MSVCHIVRMGELSLLQKSKPVEEFANSTLYDLVQDMKDTMAIENGVGIAAPQIGCNLRVIYFGFEHNTRYPDKKAVPFTTLINPEYEILSQNKSALWEGCLSIPGLRGYISRFDKIKYWGFDIEGNRVEGIAEDFHARIIQHECDHINGILFPQRIEKPEHFGFEDIIYKRIRTNTNK